MVTPHISAQMGDFAPTTLMPGDPKRAERIAEHLFDRPRLISDVRGMLAFTGTVEGRPLSVMGSGMGQPSMAIYATELYKFYGVKRIIRVGTAGGICPNVNVGDTVIATGAHTDSETNLHRIPGVHFAPVATFSLANAAFGASTEKDRLHVGTVFSSDSFYRSWENLFPRLAEYGTLAVEMETAALYAVAAEFGREALTVLTVSDHVLKDSDDMSPEEREESFKTVLDVALAAAFH